MEKEKNTEYRNRKNMTNKIKPSVGAAGLPNTPIHRLHHSIKLLNRKMICVCSFVLQNSSMTRNTKNANSINFNHQPLAARRLPMNKTRLFYCRLVNNYDKAKAFSP